MRSTLIRPATKEHEILTIAEVAAYLRVTTRTVHRYIKDGGLPYHQPGLGIRAPLRFDRTEVETWFRSR